MNQDQLHACFNYWIEKLRLKNSWDIKLECVNDESFNKTGDFKVDPDDKKAILLINVLNPKHENLEEVIVHELMHLKLYPLDQVTETLIESHYQQGTKSYDFAYTQFMTNLEQTVAELTKCFLLEFGENKHLSYGRVKTTKSFNALYENLKAYNFDE